MPGWKLISADSHISEVPETWALVQERYGAQAPRVVFDPEPALAGAYVELEGWGAGRDGPDRESCAAEYIGLVRREMNGTTGTGNVSRTGGSQQAAEFRKTFRFEDYRSPWD